MKYFYTILRILVGLTFIVSGLAKLFPIETFENTFVELGISNWLLVPFMARGIIAFEFFLGFSIVFSLWLKNKVYYTTQTTLFLFTAYLIYLLVVDGNDADCGCFGDWLTLSPWESIAKNMIMIISLYFIPRQYHRTGVSWGVTIILAVSLSLPILLNPIGLHNVQGIDVDEKVDFSGLPNLYKSDKKVDFSKGNELVAFFSYKCSHCINASRKFVSINKNQEITNLYYVIGSKNEEGLLDFIQETNPEFPIIWMSDDVFFRYSGGKLPAIVYLENGVIKKKWFGDLFDVDELKEYLKN